MEMHEVHEPVLASGGMIRQEFLKVGAGVGTLASDVLTRAVLRSVSTDRDAYSVPTEAEGFPALGGFSGPRKGVFANTPSPCGRPSAEGRRLPRAGPRY